MKTSLRKTLGEIKRKIVPKRKSKIVVLNDSGEVHKPRIHIGCGPINLEGWINLDARSAPHVNIVTNTIDLKNFADCSVGEIYLCHVLEHFCFEEVNKVLQVFKAKLKENGVLRISVPDFGLLATSYVTHKVSLQSLKFALMGGQEYEYNFHKSVYDYALLHSILTEAGFRQISRYDTVKDFGVDLGDWSTGNIASHPVSLNLKAIK